MKKNIEDKIDATLTAAKSDLRKDRKVVEAKIHQGFENTINVRIVPGRDFPTNWLVPWVIIWIVSTMVMVPPSGASVAATGAVICSCEFVKGTVSPICGRGRSRSAIGVLKLSVSVPTTPLMLIGTVMLVGNIPPARNAVAI